jgi:hypothetical protein
MCTSSNTAGFILSEFCDVSHIVGAYVECVKIDSARNTKFVEFSHQVLTNMSFRIIMRPVTIRQNEIRPRFAKGQRVVIKPVDEKGVTKREFDVNEYAGEVGEITDFYYVSLRSGQIFFIYNVSVGKEKRIIVVYEDELEPVLWEE